MFPENGMDAQSVTRTVTGAVAAVAQAPLATKAKTRIDWGKGMGEDFRREQK
jgi:hypothetical protein